MSQKLINVHNIRNFPARLRKELNMLAAELEVGVGELQVQLLEHGVKRNKKEIKKDITDARTRSI